MKNKNNSETIDPENYGISPKWIYLPVTLLVVGFILYFSLRSESSNGDHDHDDGETQWYISGMHPWIIQPEPGQCPVCGMDLTPLRPEMLTGSLSIDPQIVQNMGVRIHQAESRPFEDEIRIFATLDYPEDQIRSATARSGLYIEKLAANQTGMRINEGDLLAEVHSPEVYAAGRELLELQRQGASEGTRGAAKSRLNILGVGEATVQQWLDEGSVSWTYPIRAKNDGILRELNSREGEFVPRGASLLSYVSLDPLWVDLALYPTVLSRLHAGMKGEIYNAASQDSSEITLDYIYPTIDPLSRLGRGRALLANSDYLFRPGEFTNVRFYSEDEEESVLLPREALMDTGKRQIVYISLGDGRFEPREVRVGRENISGFVEIIDGVEAGESVVISGQFLIDSESRLRESLLKLVEGDTAADQRVLAEGDGGKRSEMPGELDQALAQWLKIYLELSEELTDDRTDNHSSLSASLQAATEELQQLYDERSDDLADIWGETISALEQPVMDLKQADRLSDIRIALRDVSEPMRKLLQETGVPENLGSPLHEVRCPMFPEMGENAWWLQKDTSTRNPYMGPAMLTCADQRNALPTIADQFSDDDHQH